MKIKNLSVVSKLFTFLARLIYYVYEHSDCMDACVPYVLVPAEVIRGSLGSPGSKSLCGCWKPDTSPLQEQQAEPSQFLRGSTAACRVENPGPAPDSD